MGQAERPKPAPFEEGPYLRSWNSVECANVRGRLVRILSSLEEPTRGPHLRNPVDQPVMADGLMAM
jgi:hypothetical protein